MHYIELKNISKLYPMGNEKVSALENVSLTINTGEFIAVTGSSGCGKSTLLHVIGGLNKPTSGEVLLQGNSLYEKTKSALALYRRNEIGIVYQFYNFVPELTAEENLILPTLMNRKQINAEEVHRILKLLGMEKHRKQYPRQLSGGQQQKIAIGRALIHRPSLLLADEPTGNLDSQKRDEILELFQYLNSKENMTILLVTHDAFVAQTAKRNIHMGDGKIIRDEVIRV